MCTRRFPMPRGGRSQRAPVARIGLSYPSRRTSRTTINVAIFALVIFVVVAIATAGATIDGSLGTTLNEQSGGYTFTSRSATAIPDLPGLVANDSTLAPYFSSVVPMYYGGIYANVSGFSGNPYPAYIYSGPPGEPPSSSFYATNGFTFTATEGGMSAKEVFAELATLPGVAIVDQSFAPVTNPGETMVLTNPLNGNRTTVTVIGIMSESLVSGVFVSPPTAAALGINGERFFFLTLAPGASVTRAAQLAKAAFFPYGLTVTSIAGILATSTAETEGVIGLLQIFVGLGLAVGIAAMGIVALRAVAERRREIGMIRANGFTRRMVLKAFFFEYTFLTLVGIGIGTALGLLLVWNLTQGPSVAGLGVATFTVPWLNLLFVLALAYGLSMLAIAEPSLRAAHMPPADAVRATE